MRRLWIIPAAIMGAVVAMTGARTAHADGTAPPADQITISVETVNGSGCAPGTAATAVASDAHAFTVTYSTYLAQVGGDSNPTSARKNCQLDLNIHVPQGFTYAIAAADYRGYASLQPGATGAERANYYFQGSPQTSSVTHPIAGAFDDDWQFTDSTDVSELVYKPCGEDVNFNINTELRVKLGNSAADAVSYMTMDSTDGSIHTTYHFAWKTCPTSTQRI